MTFVGKVQFASPALCAKHTDFIAERQTTDEWVRYATQQRKAKNKQVRCHHCRRWRFPDDRCNFFETTKEANEK